MKQYTPAEGLTDAEYIQANQLINASHSVPWLQGFAKGLLDRLRAGASQDDARDAEDALRELVACLDEPANYKDPNALMAKIKRHDTALDRARQVIEREK